METSEIEKRVVFQQDLNVMEVDFSDLVFTNSADVKLIYGTIETMIKETDKKWFFLVNYKNTQILPDAWFQYAHSGNKLNTQYSLGTVRINPDEPAKAAMKKRAEQDDSFNPNLVSSRDEALDRITELKAVTEAT